MRKAQRVSGTSSRKLYTREDEEAKEDRERSEQRNGNRGKNVAELDHSTMVRKQVYRRRRKNERKYRQEIRMEWEGEITQRATSSSPWPAKLKNYFEDFQTKSKHTTLARGSERRMKKGEEDNNKWPKKNGFVGELSCRLFGWLVCPSFVFVRRNINYWYFSGFFTSSLAPHLLGEKRQQ